MTSPIYLVDGSGYIFRAFYAVAPLTTKSGFPTNALFGFTKMLQKLLSEAKPEHIAVVFDAGRETFRNEMYDKYKANRTEPPEELIAQFPYFSEISRALGLVTLSQKGYEADDIIGTLAHRLTEKGQEVVIVTADKDMMQLVTPHISLWDTMRDKKFRREQVIEKMGVPPEKIIDLLGLVGDTSDNIPGLSGVGPKTATQLIELYDGVEGVLAKVKEISEDSRIRNRKKIAEQIESDPEIVRLSKKLATIECNAPVIFPENDDTTIPLDSLDLDQLLSKISRKEPELPKLRELSDKFEFNSMFDELAKSSLIKTQEENLNYKTIYAEDFSDWANIFLTKNEFSFDFETTSLIPWEASVVGIAVCWDSEEAFYIPVGHKESKKQQVSWEAFKEFLGDHIGSKNTTIIGQNLKYDLAVLLTQNIDVNARIFDTMIAAYLLNPDRRSYSLGALSMDHLNRSVIEYSDVIGESPDFSYVSVEAATRYSAEDAHIAWLLMEKLKPQLEEEELNKVFYEIESPLVSVLADMECKGVELDTKFLHLMSDEFEIKLDKMKKDIFEIAGSEFNLNSPKQLAEILFEKLQIPTKGLKKTKTGISTDSSVLEKLRNVHPLPALILDYRSIFKLKSTYIDALPAQVSTKTGRLHTRFNQTVTGTGRLSSSDPNLQNIPIQTEEGRRIRKAFIAKDGCQLISADYSQIELRLLAHMSGDENLIAAFNAQADIHERTAREIFNISKEEKITSEQRRVGKTINFGVVYGMGPFRLAQELGISLHTAQNYIEEYFARYPKVKDFFATLESDALEKGEVRTLFGRKRVLGELDISGRDKGFILRAAINAPIQGTAADIIKLAMVKIFCDIKTKKMPLSLVLQIHDELLFECEDSFVKEGSLFIKENMSKIVDLKVPLDVGIGAGLNWDEAH